MANHEKFNFKTLDELNNKIKELNVDIKTTTDLSPLGNKVKIKTKKTPNTLVVLPMEGCDANPDGSPSELVERRYLRYAKGGAGLIWWEACAVVPEGRANPLQKMLTKENVGDFAALLKKSNQAAADTNGSDNIPINILQVTHSGRYSRPNTHSFEPYIVQHDPLLDPRVGVTENTPLVTDDYLSGLIDKYVSVAKLAEEAGFDGIDIKSCHRYLINELLSSFEREGKYGGSFENRSRFLIDVVNRVVKATADDFITACRLNVFDAHPYPHGFGVDKEDLMKYDPNEPTVLIKKLCEAGVALLGASASNPYYVNPHVLRPYDTPSLGVPIPPEHPLESAARLFMLVADIQKAAGDVPVVGTGYSWLRQFMPNAGAANLASGKCSLIGLGRSSFAYPDAPKDILSNNIDSEKCCIACSLCTQIMRDHGRTGCVIKDSEIYKPLYQKSREEALAGWK